LAVSGGAVVGFLALWEVVAETGLVNPMFASSPSRIAIAGVALLSSGELTHDLVTSGTEFACGYLLAIAVGIPFGLALGWYRRLYYLCGPFIDVLNAVPRVTLLPIILIWFGIGLWSKIVVVFLGAVIPILINTYSGVKTNEQRFLGVARSFGASEFMIFRSVVLPGTMPYIFTGLKYASGRALLGVIVAELYAATAGIGNFITVAGNTLQTDKVFVGILIVTGVGLLTVEALNRLERRFDVWKPKVGSA
jgi:NitT/TauT family transport system permease protein